MSSRAGLPAYFNMNTKVLLFNLPPLGGDTFPISLGYIAASLAKHNIDSVIAEIDSLTVGLSLNLNLR